MYNKRGGAPMCKHFSPLWLPHICYYTTGPSKSHGQAQSLCKGALPTDMGNYEQIGNHYYNNLPHILTPRWLHSLTSLNLYWGLIRKLEDASWFLASSVCTSDGHLCARKRPKLFTQQAGKWAFEIDCSFACSFTWAWINKHTGFVSPIPAVSSGPRTWPYI